MTKTLEKKDKGPFVVPVRSQHPAVAVTLREALRHIQAHDPDFLKDEGIDPVALEIGLQIKQARLRADLTQKQLAELSGIQQGAISDIERGKGKDGPSYRTVKTLADAVGADLKLNSRDAEAGLLARESNLREVSHGGTLTLKDVFRGSDILAHVLGSTLPDLALATLTKKIRAAFLANGREAILSERSNPGEIWELEPHGKARVKVTEPSVVMVFAGPAVVSGRDNVSDRVVLASTSDFVQLDNNGSTSASVLAVPVNSRSLRDAVGA